MAKIAPSSARNNTSLLVTDGGDLRKYRIELPNLLDDSDLDPYEFRLYAHLKRRAGDSGFCNEGVRGMARHCKMSPTKVVEAKKRLEEKGFIRATPGDPKTSTPGSVVIVNIWRENFERYTPLPNASPPVPDMEHPVLVVEHPCTPGGTEERTIEEITIEEDKNLAGRASRTRRDAPAAGSDHHEGMKYLHDRCGPIPDAKAQGGALKWLLAHYSLAQAQECLDSLLEQEWRKTRVSWLTVKSEIGTWSARKENTRAGNHRQSGAAGGERQNPSGPARSAGLQDDRLRPKVVAGSSI